MKRSKCIELGSIDWDTLEPEALSLPRREKRGRKAFLDLDLLVDSRILIAGNSGAGKTFTTRRILEQSFNKIQHIVLDVEGEFRTLREEFDYVVLGSRGDAPIELKSAKVLARKLLELQASVVIDLSEFERYKQIAFVDDFIRGMIEAPQDLWRDCLVVVNETHLFAPQKEKSEGRGAIIDLATLGRKRRFCLVADTQRLSKLDKDVVAEMNNVLIGRTGQDVDQKRSGDILGFASKKDVRSLKDLNPGDFYAFGPAISREVVKVKIGPVQTTHTRAQRRKALFKKPRKTLKVKSILTELAVVPHQAAEELKTKQDYERKIKELQVELRKKPKVVVDEHAPLLDKGKLAEKIRGEIASEFERLRAREYKQLMDDYNKISKEAKQIMSAKDHALLNIISVAQKAQALGATFDIKTKIPQIKLAAGVHKPLLAPAVRRVINEHPILQPKPVAKVPSTTLVETRDSWGNKEETVEVEGGVSQEKPFKFTPAIKRVLGSIAVFHPKPVSHVRVATLSNLSSTSGGFYNYIYALRSRGYITGGQANGYNITPEGLELLGDYEPVPPDTEAILKMWSAKLSPKLMSILQVLVDEYPNGLSMEELAGKVNLSPTSGGFFNYIYKLNANSLIRKEKKMVYASNEVMGED